MAVKTSSVDWVGMGGRTMLGIPDRLRISCPKCDKEVSPKGPQLRFEKLDDRIIVKVACPVCNNISTPKVEWDGK